MMQTQTTKQIKIQQTQTLKQVATIQAQDGQIQNAQMSKNFLNYKQTVQYIFALLTCTISPYLFATVSASFGCNSSHTLEDYNIYHEMIKESKNIKKDSDLVYNLGRTAICLNKEAEGLEHLEKASSLGHIPATKILGQYYAYNHSFDEANFMDSKEDLNKAIYYFKTAAERIENTPGYPKNSSDDMVFIEAHGYTSSAVFIKLATLYFNGYGLALTKLIKNNDLSYNDTLVVLDEMEKEANRCLNRPALDVWKERKQEIYHAQQVRCTALLEFAREVRPLEEERLEIESKCEAALNNCKEHQEIMNKIDPLFGKMNEQSSSVIKIIN